VLFPVLASVLFTVGFSFSWEERSVGPVAPEAAGPVAPVVFREPARTDSIETMMASAGVESYGVRFEADRFEGGLSDVLEDRCVAVREVRLSSSPLRYIHIRKSDILC
jgi:hypothetical protein